MGMIPGGPTILADQMVMCPDSPTSTVTFITDAQLLLQCISPLCGGFFMTLEEERIEDKQKAEQDRIAAEQRAKEEAEMARLRAEAEARAAEEERVRQELEALKTECRDNVSVVVAEAEKLGTLNSGPATSPVEMFRHVYAEMPPHLLEQRQELGF